MAVPAPDELRQRHTYWREGYVQDLLAALIIGAEPPKWNTPAIPTERGWRFLDDLLEAFGCPAVGRDGARFYSEFELPRRHDDEVSGWPDFAVLSEQRLMVVELKTEAGSHRAGQLAHYADLAAHHYPNHDRQLGYLTPPLRLSARRDPVAYAHLTWAAVVPFVERAWRGASPSEDVRAAEVLVDILNRLDEQWIALPKAVLDAAAPRPAEPAGVPPQGDTPPPELLDVARSTAEDGRQRGANVAWPSPTEMEETRILLREQIKALGLPVRPWIWRSTTSGGRALTDAGREQGYELRFSRSGTMPQID